MQFIQLSLSSILEGKGGAYLEEMDRFQKLLQWGEAPSKLSSLKSLANRLNYHKARRPKFTRYMFIADELARWMVKDLMFRRPQLCHGTVGIVFLGIQKGISNTPGNTSRDLMGSELQGSIEVYLEALEQTFGNKNMPPGPQDEGWREDCDLVPILQCIDQTFAQLHNFASIEPVCWEIAKEYDPTSGVLRHGNSERIMKDLTALALAAAELVRAEAKPNHDVIAFRRMRSRSILEEGNELSGATRRFETKSFEIPQSPRAIKADPESEMFKMYRGQGELYFIEGDLKTADRMFAACTRELENMQHPFQDARLEVQNWHNVVLLQLGHYSTANIRLHEALNYAKKLLQSRDFLEEHRPKFRAQQTQLIYRYATALMRLGDYENAANHLQELIDEDRENKKVPGFKAASGHFEIYIGAYRMLSLNENYLGHFRDVDEDPYLLEADAMLRKIKQDRDASIKKVKDQKPQALDIHGRTIEGSVQSQGEVFKDSTIDRSQDQNLNILEHQLNLTRVNILSLQGYYGRARDVAQSSYRSLKYELGSNNILTLEAAVLTAHLLVSTSKMDEGERAAEDARRRIVKNFNEGHPLATEAIHVLIMAYTAQGRSIQALGTSQQLCRIAASSESLGRTEAERMRHPQMLKFYAQFSDAKLNEGNYSEAEKVMREQVLEHTSFGTTMEAKVHQQSTVRPPIAKYLAHLAWAQLHRGKVREPKNNITRAL